MPFRSGVFLLHTCRTPDPIHWQFVRAVTLALLVVWFGVTFVATFFARQLDFIWFGWPFSYWMAAQGALLVYVVLIGAYAWAMSRLDAIRGQGGG